jgi:endonuclease YncB( thermonuclease family)
MLCGFAPSASTAEIQRGRVVSIADGDTLTLLAERRQIKVRLADIDAPERRQAYGTRSRQSLAQLCHGKAAELEARAWDRYGRAVGRVTCAGTDANADQVARGMAWVFDRYAARDSPLYALQRDARAGQRGLWADPLPMPPWEFRRKGRK